jgi:hypothetical protein
MCVLVGKVAFAGRTSYYVVDWFCVNLVHLTQFWHVCYKISKWYSYFARCVLLFDSDKVCSQTSSTGVCVYVLYRN